ncbi:MAG: translation initiation factor IF-2 [Agathobacter sp.]|nr:translation initiation factor IF-2 [Lachnospiraceae bacterium]MDY2619265.1 translation initiation factor IF-2 [Agathobacter sp.]
MAKMRVHELAKELNIKSQDIIELLSTTDYAVKSASSGIEDAAQAVVRNKFSKKEDTKPAAKAEKAVTKAEDAKTEEGKERPKKKSSITAVFNAQYSKQSRRPGQGNGNNNRNNRDNNRGSRRDNGQQRPEQHSIIRPRPVGERAMRPISERTASNVDDFAESRPAKQNAEKQNNRPQNGNRQDRPNRSNGDRPQNGNRQERQNRQDRPNRSNGDRPQNGNRQERPLNDRNNDRRNNNKGRFDKELNRFNKEAAAAAPEEVRGKEGRDRNNDRRNNNRHQEHDKLGGKRQENYVNLEKHGGKKKPQQQPQKPKEDEDVIKTITLPEKMTIRDLADKMKVQPAAIVKKLFMKGQMVTVNQEIDFDAAEEIALEFNYICEPEEKVDVIAELLKEDEEDPKDLVPRPPVVCVMGHVDHGKTSLLDAIRSTRVTDREAGGITQHIGASVVSINGQNITFLDTPGHEAFTAMRMRGANSTDIAILVVAADDGVMPQTVEAINHAKAAGVEIIVAVNKIDKPSANIEKVKQELSEYELIPEDWGGSTIFCPVSAHTKEGIDNLLEMILLTAEVLELKANPNRNARGLVIEAQLDKGRGAVATVLVQKGTLHVGDSIACGSSYGKVRAMIDDKGQRVKKAIPSTPVEILGLNSVPAAGETFVVCDSDKEAKAFADTYISEEKNRLIEDTKAKMSLDDLFSQIQSGNMKELDIIVKADVQGSVEAVKQSLVKLSNEEVVVKVIHGGVGAINESDVILASASNAIIIGFNVRPDPIAKVTADNEGVDIRLYKVIYNAIEDVEAAMKGMLDPVFEEKVIGHAEIRQIFKASGVGNIAGSYVLDGVMERGCRVRISREGKQIFEGDLASLKRFKDDVKEVKTGFECGLVFDGFNDIQEFDQVEAYKMVEVPR